MTTREASSKGAWAKGGANSGLSTYVSLYLFDGSLSIFVSGVIGAWGGWGFIHCLLCCCIILR